MGNLKWVKKNGKLPIFLFYRLTGPPKNRVRCSRIRRCCTVFCKILFLVQDGLNSTSLVTGKCDINVRSKSRFWCTRHSRGHEFDRFVLPCRTSLPSSSLSNWKFPTGRFLRIWWSPLGLLISAARFDDQVYLSRRWTR